MGNQNEVEKNYGNDVEQTNSRPSSSMIRRLGRRDRRMIFSVAEKDNEQYIKFE